MTAIATPTPPDSCSHSVPVAVARPPALMDEASTSAQPSGGATRHIRSFVMRRGHVSDAQRAAHTTLSPKYTAPFEARSLDCATLFGRRAPVILEIGFGMGHSTAEIAARRPDCDFLGIEVYTPGVGSLLRQIHERALPNLRIIQHDAVEVLRDMIPPGSLAGVHIYFPDPWPKKRHHKRRLIQAPFVQQLTERLTPGGYIHCATDWEDYAHQMLAVLTADPQLRNTASGFASRPEWRPETKFERRGMRLGHSVWDVLFQRHPAEETPQ